MQAMMQPLESSCLALCLFHLMHCGFVLMSAVYRSTQVHIHQIILWGTCSCLSNMQTGLSP